MAGTQKQRAKGFCSPSGEKRYCSVRKQNFSKSRWREKVPICPAVPHFQSGTVCPAVTAEGERRRYLLDGKFGSKVLGGVCCRIGREVRPMLGPGAPALRAGARGSRFASVGNCAPHFLLSWQKKTCRARYKRKPPFSGLLVRPAKTGLVSSSCAEPLALPVRLRRSCPVSNNLLVQIGLLSATAPLPLSGQKKNVYASAGKKLATNARPSGSGARGTTGPLCTLKSAPNVTNAARAF